MLKTTTLLLSALLGLGYVSGCTSANVGTLGGPCYGNGTCNDDLVCGADTKCALPPGVTDLAMPGGGDDMSGSSSDMSASSDDLATYGDDLSGNSNDLSGVKGDLNRPARDLSTTDLALACGSAVIYHPGTETRLKGSSVYVFGAAADANCSQIDGAKFTWTDSAETPMLVATGNGMTYKLNTAGVHTLTLTAKGTAANYTASVTFMVN